MPAKKKQDPLARMQSLVSGQRRDFDQLAKVISHRDQLADNRHQGCMRDNAIINTVAHAQSGLQEMVINLQDRLNWYETRVPAIGREKKRFDQWMAKERARRANYIKKHPDLDEPTRRYYALVGKMPKMPKPKIPASDIGAAVERQSGS